MTARTGTARARVRDGAAGRWLVLAGALGAQVAWRALAPAWHAAPAPLPPAPPPAVLRLAALGDAAAAARVTVLYVQAHDDQAAGSIALASIDYARLRDWLAAALTLDPHSGYPLLLASEVYAAVPDPRRARVMLDLVYRAFEADPERRWPWLAQAALVARHRLHDRALARSYARAVRTRAPGAPAWARELDALFAANDNELDDARALIGGLLRSGTVTDPRELRFLEQRLRALEAPAAR